MISFFEQQLEELDKRGQLRSIRSLRHSDYKIEYEGASLVNLSGNDYLGIGSDNTLRNEFLHEMLSQNIPLGSCSSRLLTGNDEQYEALEEALKIAYGKESALLFNSGYHANVGIIGAIADKETLVLSDKLVHASVIDGLKLSDAVSMRFRHNDLNHLETLLKRYRDQYKRTVVITESIFSMDGDCADLRGLAALRKHYSFLLYVDEAHAVGVRGKRGLGLAEDLNLLNDIDLLVGTFGKAFASMGAYLICDRTVREILVNRCRPLIFSTALPPLTIAWSRFVFERMASMDNRRRDLALLSEQLGKAVGGFESHIIPMVLGENERAMQVSKELQREGYFALPIRPPTVPVGTSRLRFSLSAAIPTAEIGRLAEIIILMSNE